MRPHPLTHHSRKLPLRYASGTAASYGPAQYRVDTMHSGPDRLLSYGDEPLFVTALSLAPFGSGSHEPGLYVEEAGFARTLDPAEVNELADALVEHATQLRAMARTPATLLARVDR
ncbi:DUF6907 domain-containing protein [Streptomyces sp. NPDC059743]|uniref:DUF6907 domain-containing protein n=1 Tax=Streptomyces sp. NPDC059743 TaxID=3346928 RepID=UPI00364A0980